MLSSVTQTINNAFKHLPQEAIKPIKRKEVWINVLGATVVLMLCNGFADLFLNYLNSNRGYFLVSLKWKLLQEQTQPVDWLVVGDSSCNQGVIPETLMQQLNGNALNLCTVGSMLTLDDVWMLQQHIHHVGPPRQVVIIHVYDIWHRELEEETLAHLAQIPLSDDEISAFEPALELDGGKQVQLFLHRSLPLYAAHRSLEEWIREPIESFRESREFIVTKRGFMPRSETNLALFQRDVRNHLKFVSRNAFKLSDINQRSLMHLRTLADQHQFDVYFAAAPLYEGLYEDRAFRRYFRQMQRSLADFAATSDRLHVILNRPITFEPEDMQNVDHLKAPAAEVYTRRLAEAIAQHQSLNRPKP